MMQHERLNLSNQPHSYIPSPHHTHSHHSSNSPTHYNANYYKENKRLLANNDELALGGIGLALSTLSYYNQEVPPTGGVCNSISNCSLTRMCARCCSYVCCCCCCCCTGGTAHHHHHSKQQQQPHHQHHPHVINEEYKHIQDELCAALHIQNFQIWTNMAYDCFGREYVESQAITGLIPAPLLSSQLYTTNELTSCSSTSLSSFSPVIQEGEEGEEEEGEEKEEKEDRKQNEERGVEREGKSEGDSHIQFHIRDQSMSKLVPFICFHGAMGSASPTRSELERDFKAMKEVPLYTSHGRVAGMCGDKFFHMYSELLKPQYRHYDISQENVDMNGNNKGEKRASTVSVTVDDETNMTNNPVTVSASASASGTEEKNEKETLLSQAKTPTNANPNANPNSPKDSNKDPNDHHHVLRLMDVMVHHMKQTNNGCLIIGHSLGGALATLFFAELLHDHKRLIDSKVHVITFGSPRCIDLRLSDKLDRCAGINLRFVNDHDIMSAYPPTTLSSYAPTTAPQKRSNPAAANRVNVLQKYHHWGKCIFAPDYVNKADTSSIPDPDDAAAERRRQVSREEDRLLQEWIVIHDPKQSHEQIAVSGGWGIRDFGIDHLSSSSSSNTNTMFGGCCRWVSACFRKQPHSSSNGSSKEKVENAHVLTHEHGYSGKFSRSKPDSSSPATSTASATRKGHRHKKRHDDKSYVIQEVLRILPSSALTSSTVTTTDANATANDVDNTNHPAQETNMKAAMLAEDDIVSVEQTLLMEGK